jgi:ABC-type multidrug transport system ATPase subunit
MQENLKQIFTYTRKRQDCYRFVGTFSAVFLFEAGIWSVLILFLVPNLFLKLGLLAAIILLNLFTIFGFILMPLWTKHTVTSAKIILRYGYTVVEIPRQNLFKAQPVTERLLRPYLVRMEYEGMKQRLVATFSAQGLVLLQLDGPHSFRVNRRQVQVRQILINLDYPEQFIATLNPNLDLGTPHASIAAAIPSIQALAVERKHPQLPQVQIPLGSLAIQTKNLSRSYDNFVAVSNVNLLIHHGEVYGFLGANGAGKSTTIKMLVGLITPTSGTAHLNGYNIRTEEKEAKTGIGYVPDQSMLYERLTGREFLSFLAHLHNVAEQQAQDRINHYLKLLDLEAQADRLCGSYSLGMKRKLALAGALLHAPSILILDEPLNGLDPRSARKLKDLFLELAASGVAVLLSIHDLATAEEVCQRVGIIHHGQIVAEGNVADLRHRVDAHNLEEVFLQLTQESEVEDMA